MRGDKLRWNDFQMRPDGSERQWNIKERPWKVKERPLKVKERQWQAKERQWKIRDKIAVAVAGHEKAVEDS